MALGMKEFFANTPREELVKLWEQVKEEENVVNDTIYAGEFLEFIDSYHREVMKIPIACFTEEENLTPEYSGSFFLFNLVACNWTKRPFFR